MQFTSVYYIIFYLFTLLLIRIVPSRGKKFILILANLIFYLSSGLIGGLFLLCVSIVSYSAGILIYNRQKNVVSSAPDHFSKFLISSMGILWIVLLLFYHKSGVYYPLGFSFYSLMAIGYVIDVLQNKHKPLTSFLDYFLCLSFFPIIQSGPIDNIYDLSTQLKKTDFSNNTDYVHYFLYILWGLLEKIAISNIASILIEEIFGNYASHSWLAIAIATILYAFQLYADFDGYSNIAYGCAGLLGIQISYNFCQPYLAISIRDFWRRWHISLSTWLKDYVYIPLGGSRCGKLRKYINIVITFIVSGIWHGTGLNFLIWGALHGLYQVVEDFLETTFPKRNTDTSSKKNFLTNTEHIIKIIITFILVDFAWFFFRANSIQDAVQMLGRLGAKMPITVNSLIEEFAMSELNYIHIFYMISSLILLIACDVLRHCKVKIYTIYMRLPILIRYFVLYSIILWIIAAALTTCKMDTSNFIYGQF